MLGLRPYLAGAVRNSSISFFLLSPLSHQSTVIERQLSISTQPQLFLLRPTLSSLQFQNFQSSQTGASSSGTVSKTEEDDDDEEKAAKPSRVRRYHPREGDSQVDARPPPRRGLLVVEHSLETGMAYMQSEAYRATYGDSPVWFYYRRNLIQHFAPPTTRKSCIKGGKIATGSPCPICRDEYLVLHYKNTALLEQFIHSETGEVFETGRTSLCQMQHQRLLAEIAKARDLGLLESPEYGPPHVFDYEEYWPTERVAHLSHSHPPTASVTGTAPSQSLPSTRPAQQQQQSVEAKAASVAATQGSSISPPAPTAAQP